MRQESPKPSDHPRRYPAAPGLLLLLGLVVFGLVPELVRREAVRRLEARIDAPVAIADVNLNLFTGSAHLSDLVIGGRGGSHPLLRVPTLDLTFSRRALLRRELIIHRARAHQPALYLQRTGPTRWNVDKILRARGEEGRHLRRFTIEQLEVEGGLVTIVDRTTTPVVTSLLRDFDLTLRPVPLTPGAKAGGVTGKARLNKGRVRMRGTLHLNPFVTHLKVTATGVPLAGFHGYIHQLFGSAESLAGEFDGRLDVAAALTGQGHLTLEARGVMEGQRVAFGLPGDREPFFRATRLAAELSRVRMMPVLRVEVNNVEFTGATLRIAREADGTFHLRRLWGASHAERTGGTPRSPGPSKVQTPLVIRHLAAHDSRIEFVDATVTPVFTGALSEVTAEVHNTSPRSDRATVKLTGNMGGSAPIALRGWFTPVARPRTVYIEGTVQDYELSRVNPYAEKYMRHRVRRGRVSTEVKYRYDAGDLAAANEIRIRRIKLGNALGDEFHEQVGIPLKLALALLEGLNGEIRLRIPVRGNLERPEFRLNKVVWKAVRSAILKTLTVPFRVVGTILTVGGRITAVRIKPVDFAPGSLTLDPPSAARLKRLTAFLRDRPKLELQLRGRASRQEAKALPRTRRRGRATTDQALQALAQERARHIERILVHRGIAEKRLFVVTNDPRAVRKGGSGRVEFRILH